MVSLALLLTDVKGRKSEEYALGSGWPDDSLIENFKYLDKVQRYLVVAGESKGKPHEEVISQTN